MSRILSRILALLLVPMARGYGQTATVKPQAGTTKVSATSPTTITCAIAKNGKTVTCPNVSLPIPALAVDVPGQDAPLSLAGFGAAFTCTGGTPVLNELGAVIGYTNITCTLKKVSR